MGAFDIAIDQYKDELLHDLLVNPIDIAKSIALKGPNSPVANHGELMNVVIIARRSAEAVKARNKLKMMELYDNMSDEDQARAVIFKLSQGK